MNWIETVYLASAIIGGLLFLFRLVLFFVGGVSHGDFIDGDFDVDGDIGPLEVHDGDIANSADSSFKFLSLQGISAFFMMFGLIGLALSQMEIHRIWTVLGGLAAGGFTVWVVSLIFSGMKRLQSDGTIRMASAVGREGTVYLTIPKGGTGKVTVIVQGGLREFDAISEENKKLETGEHIRVVKVISGDTLVVEKI